MVGPVLELFHRLAEPTSAEARRYVVDYALEDRVRFRNVAFEEAQAAWKELGGHSTPALWDGEHLHQGAQAVLARLQAVVNLGRDG
ncbi:hypothetical protein KYC5002_03080 [Archangium violaceum]|uniref:hypothetical protein n=1 Tax=Archangium violaceum TaxID=83451 RepID=UPI002B292AD9|nr:hypothetical protein KYC5002_03080 [Archangium gephyra]